MPPTNTFAGAALDRASARRDDAAWVEKQRAHPNARAIVVSAEGPFVDRANDPCRPAYVPLAETDASESVFLGLDAEGPVFAVAGDAVEGARTAMSLRDAGAHMSQADGALLAYATAVLGWHANHRFCARCGHATEPTAAGHERHCPNCGATHHPRTDPVVIMLVEDGDRVLLGRQARWPEGRYSALAGFVEPGESLEEAVAREVAEESGVQVTGVRARPPRSRGRSPLRWWWASTRATPAARRACATPSSRTSAGSPARRLSRPYAGRANCTFPRRWPSRAG